MSFMATRELDKARNTSAKAGRLCSLDGLRAISIILVLVGHLNGTRVLDA